MKAYKIVEIQDFTQGGDAYKKLNVGKYDENIDWLNPKKDDIIELQENIYYIYKLEFYKDIVTASEMLKKLTDTWREKGCLFTFDYDHGFWVEETGTQLSLEWVEEHSESFKKIRK